MNAVTEVERVVNGLPDCWRSLRLGDVSRLGGGTTPARDEAAYWDDASVPWATPSDITSLPSGITTIASTESMVSDRALAECSLPLNLPGTVLMTSRATIGFAAINTVPMTTNQGFITFTVGPDLDAAFLLQWLIAQRPNLVAAAGGSTFKELSRGTAKLLSIRLPPLDEQRRIAEVLRSVDDAIAATQRTVNEASNVRQVTLDAMIQRVLDCHECDVRPLADVAEIRTGLAKNKNRTGPKVHVPYLRVANVQDGWFDLADMQEIEVDPSQIDRYRLQAGDVLLTEGGDYDKLGRGGVWHGQITPCLHQNHVFCVRPDISALLPDYFALTTQSAWGRAYFLTCAKRTTNLASINSSQLRAFPVPVVPPFTQAALIEEVAAIDAMIDLEELQLGTLLRLRAEVSSDLLSGRVRVPA